MSNYLGGNFDGRELKDYKGYGVEKCWNIDYYGRKLPGGYFYLVSDGNDIDGYNYIGEEYDSLEDAHNAIDEWTRR